MYRKLLFLSYLIVFPYFVYSQSIDMCISDGDFIEAVNMLDKAIKNEPDNINYLLKKGSVLRKLEKYSESVKCYLKAFKIDSTNVRISNSLGELYKLTGQINQSIYYFNHTLKLNSENYYAINLMAEIYYQKRDYAKALVFYSKIIKIDSLNYSANYNLGKTYYAIDSLDIAESYFKQAIVLNRNHLKSLLSLSNLYHAQEKLEEAIDILDNGLRIDSLNVNFNLKKANLLYLMKEYKEAVPYFQNALAYGDTTKISLYKQLSVCLEQSYYFDEAIDVLKRALLLNDEDPVLYFYLGVVYSRMSQFKMSNEYMLKAIDFSIPEKQIALYYAHLGNNFYRLEEFGNSINFNLETLKYQPARYSVFYDIAVIYEKDLKNFKQAVKYYELFLEKDKNLEKDIRAYVEERITKLNEEIFFKGDNQGVK